MHYLENWANRMHRIEFKTQKEFLTMKLIGINLHCILIACIIYQSSVNLYFKKIIS